MSGHDSKYFSTIKKGEIPELEEELNSQYKVCLSIDLLLTVQTKIPSFSKILDMNNACQITLLCRTLLELFFI
jgi:hypothetical protein